MRATYQCRPGLTVEVTGESQRDLFRELSSAAEVFGEPCCGACLDTAIVPLSRTAKGFEFFELACTNPKCGARLSFGVRKDDGRLFPKRRLDPHGRPVAPDEAGELTDTRGWTTYRGDDAPAPSAARQAQRTPPHGTPTPAASAAAPPKPATAPPLGKCISAEQWQQLQEELKKRFISPRAFLERYTFGSPRDIMATHFDEALAAARQPDAELLAAQKRVKAAHG